MQLISPCAPLLSILPPPLSYNQNPLLPPLLPSPPPFSPPEYPPPLYPIRQPNIVRDNVSNVIDQLENKITANNNNISLQLILLITIIAGSFCLAYCINIIYILNRKQVTKKENNSNIELFNIDVGSKKKEKDKEGEEGEQQNPPSYREIIRNNSLHKIVYEL